MNGKKTPDMLLLEDAFKDLKSGNTSGTPLELISRIIKRNFDINMNVTVVENRNGKFFGMSIYPSQSLVQVMVDQLLNKKASSDVIVKMWQENKDWSLEIDSVLLKDGSLNANPAEMTAILLHEIGHIVYSNTIPQRLHRIIRYKVMEASFILKKLLQWPKAQKLIQLAFIEACSSKSFRLTSLETERIADKFVIAWGYGDNLDTFIGKLIGTKGNELVNRTESQMDKDVKITVDWALVNISELEFRKTALRTSLQAELLKNPSKMVRDVVYDIKKAFFGENADSDKYKTSVIEQYLISDSAKIVKEGFLGIFDKVSGKVKKITQLDVDILNVEVSKIQNEDDKIYVLELIYDKLNIINAALDLIASGSKDKVPVSKETLTSYKNQLDKLRAETLNLKLAPKQFGMFIKYPRGYEG